MSESRKAWGYDMLIALLEEYGIDENLKADIHAIRQVAEKEEDDADRINTNYRSCCSGYIGNANNSSRAEQARRGGR